jgi:hypothetical protein
VTVPIDPSWIYRILEQLTLVRQGILIRSFHTLEDARLTSSAILVIYIYCPGTGWLASEDMSKLPEESERAVQQVPSACLPPACT